MLPSVQPLNLNWELSPQEQNTLNVEAGVDKFFSDPIRRLVKDKRDEEAFIDKTLQETIKNTSGRFSSDIMQMVYQGRDMIKEVSKGKFNSPEARLARQQILGSLTAASQKANYIEKTMTEGLANVETQKYKLVNKIRTDAMSLLQRPLWSIETGDVDRLFNSDEYTDMVAKTRDAVDEHIGKETTKSPLYTQRAGRNTIVAQKVMRNNFRVKKDEKGNIVYKGGEPELEDNLDDNSLMAIMLKVSSDKTDPRTGMPTAYKYFEDHFARQNPEAYRLTEGKDKDRMQFVLNNFRALVNGPLLQPKVEEVSTKGDPADYSARYEAASRYNQDYINLQNRATTIDSVVAGLESGDLNPFIAVLQSNPEYRNSQPTLVKKISDGYVIDGNGRVEKLSDIKTDSPELVGPDGNLSQKALNEGYSPFTGVFFKLKTKNGTRHTAYRVNDWVPGSSEIYNAASSLISSIMPRGTTTPIRYNNGNNNPGNGNTLGGNVR